MNEQIMQSLDKFVNFVLWLTFTMLCSFMIVIAIGENVRPGFIHEGFHIITNSTDEIEQLKNCAAYNTKLKGDIKTLQDASIFASEFKRLRPEEIYDKLTCLKVIEEKKDEIFRWEQKHLGAQDHIDRLSKVCGRWIFDPVRPIQRRRGADSTP